MVFKQKWLLLLFATFCLTGGALFYLYVRPQMILFKWLYLQTIYELPDSSNIKLLSGYLGDLAWVVALYCLVVFFSQEIYFQPNVKKFLISLPFVAEGLQSFSFFPGTFDWFDIILYFIVFLFFSILFPQFIHMQKQKLKIFLPVITGILFFAMALACATPKASYKPKPLPCVTHKGLNYSPVLTRINLSGSYTMKDLNGAQRYAYDYVMDELRRLNPGKYQLADGVTPNLTIDIVINTDSYQHYGATLNMYVYDGSVYYSWGTDYVTVDKLYDDICAKANTFISYGWCTNCPSPCNP
jgi:hypothetical protein